MSSPCLKTQFRLEVVETITHCCCSSCAVVNHLRMFHHLTGSVASNRSKRTLAKRGRRLASRLSVSPQYHAEQIRQAAEL
eukprot:4692553-Pleurochrysis_carterae.AAC.1